VAKLGNLLPSLGVHNVVNNFNYLEVVIMNNLNTLEEEVRIQLKDYRSKRKLILDLIPDDLDELLLIVKSNPDLFEYEISNIQSGILRYIERKIGLI